MNPAFFTCMMLWFLCLLGMVFTYTSKPKNSARGPVEIYKFNLGPRQEAFYSQKEFIQALESIPVGAIVHPISFPDGHQAFIVTYPETK